MDHPTHDTGDEVARAKAALRTAVLDMVRQLDDQARAAASTRACTHLLGLRSIQLAGVVACYRAVEHELDPTSAQHQLQRRGARVLLPRLVDERIVLTDAGDPGLLVTGPSGVPEPASGAVDPDAVAAIVVPGVAFDLDGGRLGRGGGHYDRLLSRLPVDTVRIGLAHGTQLVTRVPRADHDELLDVVVSDRGVHHSRARTTPRDA